MLHDLLADVATVVVDLSAATLLDAHSAGMRASTRRSAGETGHNPATVAELADTLEPACRGMRVSRLLSHAVARLRHGLTADR